MIEDNSQGDELAQARRRIQELERTLAHHELLQRQHLVGQRALIERLEGARNEALTAVAAKDDFLAAMSHEFRTPMNGILGAIQLLADVESDGEREELVRSVASSAEGLLDLLSDVLDFASLGQSKMQLNPVEFDVSELVDSVMASMADYARERSFAGAEVVLRSSCSSELPGVLRGDTRCLRQILRNLVSNAIKFTDAGRVELQVRTDADDPSNIEFHVVDTGVGIQPDQLDRIFEPFTQEDASSTRRFGGSGLGLSICRRIAEVMQGEITAKSQPGVGSTFTFRAPLGRVHGAGVLTPKRSDLEPSSSALDADENGERPLRVLLVDDQAINQKIGEKFLGRFGVQVATASNGEEALRLVEEQSFDLILMDCTMPVMDGFEATRRIRGLTSSVASVPIVALTALAMPGDRERCLGAGMDGYLAKPIRREELGRALHYFARGA